MQTEEIFLQKQQMVHYKVMHTELKLKSELLLLFCVNCAYAYAQGDHVYGVRPSAA